MEDDFEKRIRHLRRRIEEARNKIYSTRPETIERVQTVDEQRPRVEKTSKEKELDSLRQKLRRK